MEFFCSPSNTGAKITVQPKINPPISQIGEASKSNYQVSLNVRLEPDSVIVSDPVFLARYDAQTKELEINEVRRSSIAPRQRFLQHILAHLIEIQGISIACINYEVVDNDSALNLLMPLFREAPDHQELIGSHVESDCLCNIPMVSALIALGFKALHIVPLSERGGAIFGLKGFRSIDLSLRRTPVKPSIPAYHW
jgi:hypothetical protein